MKAKKENPSSKSWQRHCDQMRNGFTWNLTLLNRVPGGDLQVVDFHHVFTVPRDFVEAYLKATQPQRFRLLPPYREHVSQAFARFFMRVGLPTPIEKTW